MSFNKLGFVPQARCQLPAWRSPQLPVGPHNVGSQRPMGANAGKYGLHC